jgi:hypothetical protein
MGLASFFRKLLGGEKPAAAATYAESTSDPVKDATDFAIAQQELVSENAQPILKPKSAFETDSDEEAESFNRDIAPTNRIEENAD